MVGGHYGSDYFAWQRSVGNVGAVLNQRKFRAWIRPSDTVLDFGCGSGALLSALPGTTKIGIEIGEEAREAASELGLVVHDDLSDVTDGSVDVVISNHALEHVAYPLNELRNMRRVLKTGGRAILVVPIDDWRNQRAPNRTDPNHHLHTWTPLLFANLLVEAGFEVEACRVMTHAWRRKSLILHRLAPPPLYNAAAWALAVLTRSRQIHAIARKA